MTAISTILRTLCFWILIVAISGGTAEMLDGSAPNRSLSWMAVDFAFAVLAAFMWEMADMARR